MTVSAIAEARVLEFELQLYDESEASLVMDRCGSHTVSSRQVFNVFDIGLEIGSRRNDNGQETLEYNNMAEHD